LGIRVRTTKLGYDEGKLRCYKCKQLGHFKRECPLPIVTEPVNSGNSRTVPIQERAEEVKPRKETALLTNFDWSAEIEETKEEINHALIAEIIEEPVLDDNYIDCFDPFKEFYGEDGENYDKATEVKVVMIEEGQDGKDQEATVTIEDQTDVIVQGHLGQEEVILSRLVCEAAVNKVKKVFVTAVDEVKNAEEAKLCMEAIIEKAKHEAVGEYKRNTPNCQCDRALVAEKLLIGLPYEAIKDMCSSACKIRFIGIYKANKLLMSNENELKKLTKSLKRINQIFLLN